ncbi:hypothetical protein FSOLCH5_014461 [Fusarium solani]
MITKGCVQSNKTFVGIASYGRSFKISKAGSQGLSARSQARGPTWTPCPAPGRAPRGTYRLPRSPRSFGTRSCSERKKEWHDESFDTDIVVYQETEGLSFSGVSVGFDKVYGNSSIGSGDDD